MELRCSHNKVIAHSWDNGDWTHSTRSRRVCEDRHNAFPTSRSLSSISLRHISRSLFPLNYSGCAVSRPIRAISARLTCGNGQCRGNLPSYFLVKTEATVQKVQKILIPFHYDTFHYHRFPYGFNYGFRILRTEDSGGPKSIPGCHE